MRRFPQQNRGQRRVEQILDAAAAIVGEVGLEGLSTNLIAQRAGASIGSIYQFFEHKDAIIEKLCERYAKHIATRLVEINPRDNTCKQYFSAAIETVSEYYAVETGFRAMMFGIYASRETLVIDQTLWQPLRDHFAHAIAHYAPHMNPSEAVLRAELALYALVRLLYVQTQRAEPQLDAMRQIVDRLLLEDFCSDE